MKSLRWAHPAFNRNEQVKYFAKNYLANREKPTLLVCGAGFDPRATEIAVVLSSLLGKKIHGLFIREERPDPDQRLLGMADANEKELSTLIPTHSISRIDVFESDGAVCGGRAIVKAISSRAYHEYGDIVIDMSALSAGISFPMVKYFIEEAQRFSLNVHMMVAYNSAADLAVKSIASDQVMAIHSFDAGSQVDDDTVARLWLPQLTGKDVTVHRLIYQDRRPHDVCPIVPFPSRDLRLVDQLLDRYSEELLNSWNVDPSNLIYAAEDNPLDLYRTIVQLFDARTEVFKEVGGSRIIVTPAGNRLLGIGVLMAALDREISLYYVESIGYTLNGSMPAPHSEQEIEIWHIWLHDAVAGV